MTVANFQCRAFEPAFSFPAKASRASSFGQKEGHYIAAATLGEAITRTEELLKIRIAPAEKGVENFDASHYFRVNGTGETYRPWVGIDIRRKSGTVVSPAYKLDEPLLDDDMIGIGVLAGS